MVVPSVVSPVVVVSLEVVVVSPEVVEVVEGSPVVVEVVEVVEGSPVVVVDESSVVSELEPVETTVVPTSPVVAVVVVGPGSVDGDVWVASVVSVVEVSALSSPQAVSPRQIRR